jgi:regulator of PEP synthase PpsR (kinase-PPPase family)
MYVLMARKRFLELLDKHAPIRKKEQIVSQIFLGLLITKTIKFQIRKRDHLKSLAIKSKYISRNRVTNALQEAEAACYKAQFESVKHEPKQA